MIIDTHSHVNFKAFDKDRGEVMARAKEKKTAMINVGSNFSTSQKAVELADARPNVFAAIGLHPVHLFEQIFEEEGEKIKTSAENFDFAGFELLAGRSECVAIGETGLDYYHLNSRVSVAEQKETQKNLLIDHLELANGLHLPVILHCRGSQNSPKDAYVDLIEILKKHEVKGLGVLHCFAGDWQVAKEFLDLGFYLGFTGIITYSKSLELLEVVSKMPEDKILSETDCPYLTPAPYRGQRNEPIFVEYIIEKISALRKIEYVEAAELTFQNAKRLFNLPMGD
ncbi:MAG TPA: TatD family hydrolase [Candidatus Bipolaricaulota bacterium]|nr:TatD family hydrolase [Candidatus Bipolaricaulota bacterium]